MQKEIPNFFPCPVLLQSPFCFKYFLQNCIFLENMSTGKGVLRAGYGNKEGKGMLGADYGNKMDF